MPYLLVDPSAVLNFQFDWDEWLASGVSGSPTDTIVSRQWSISPLNAGSPTTPILANATNDVVFVEGLEAGKVYRLVEHVVTASGVEDERTIVLRSEDT